MAARIPFLSNPAAKVKVKPFTPDRWLCFTRFLFSFFIVFLLLFSFPSVFYLFLFFFPYFPLCFPFSVFVSLFSVWFLLNFLLIHSRLQFFLSYSCCGPIFYKFPSVPSIFFSALSPGLFPFSFFVSSYATRRAT